MDDIVRVLSTGFDNPLEPAFCTACVYRLRDRLACYSEKEYRTTLRQLRRSHHDLLTGFMLFLTTPYDRDARAALAARLVSTMSCCPLATDSPDHSEAATDIEESNVLASAAIMLFDLIHQCFVGAIFIARKQSFNRNGLWPTSDDDVLPLGAEASCPALLVWFARIADCQVYTAIADLLLLCPAVMRTIVETDWLRLAFLRVIAKHLDMAVAKHAQSPQRLDEDSQTPLSLLRDLSTLMEAVTIRCGPYGSHPFGRLVAGVEDALLASVMRAADIVRDAPTKEHLHNFALSIHFAKGTLDGMPRHLRRWLFTWLNQVGGTYGTIYDLLRSVSARRVCAATGCGRPEHALETRLLVCSQCHVLRYCSRACQKAHWKSGKTPHKEACPLIKQVLDSTDITLTREEFAEACRAAKIPHETLARIYEKSVGRT
ncbi:hypothetical protein AURDEDRAFT_168471 [Auricularia subglabra TFB-10046 SS5]|nr:hypothetical protein AURDEDRAFT_168471 [Auricularia subglabra TFB-10046 SS5]